MITRGRLYQFIQRSSATTCDDGSDTQPAVAA